MTLSMNQHIELFNLLVQARTFEIEMFNLEGSGWHSAIGEEAVPVGAFYGLRKDDNVVFHYRGFIGGLLARGVPAEDIWRAFLRKKGYGTEGIGLPRAGFYHAYGVIPNICGVLGQTISLATGTAFASKLLGKDYVSVVSFGDGTTNRGNFHEALNIARMYMVPIVFVCQNNQYAISTSVHKSVGQINIADRSMAYGFPGVIVDGNDVIAVNDAITSAVARARESGGPTLVECKTFRVRGHNERDTCTYRRDAAEVEAWTERCPIKKMKEFLISQHPNVDVAKLESDATKKVKDAFELVRLEPEPGEEVLSPTLVYAQSKRYVKAPMINKREKGELL